MASNPRPPAPGYPAPTNGYPYGAPYGAGAPANHYYDPYHAAAPRRPAFIRSFLLTLVALIVIAGVVWFIFWLIVRPRVPSFHVASLSVSNFSVSNLSDASASISATWLLTLRVANPNKKIRISYGEMVSSISYPDEELARAHLPPLYQGTRTSTNISVGFNDWNYYVSRRAANGIEGDRAAHGIVDFDVRVEALARFRAGHWWWTRSRLVRVYCQSVPIKFTGNSTGSRGSGLSGGLIGSEKDCWVRI